MNDLEHLVTSSRKAADRWAGVAVVVQPRENADTPAECLAKWQKIYRLFDTTGESEQDEVFAAVNLYFLANGCSPAGKYSKPIQTASGKEASAAEVVKILGSQEGEIRQFLRGRLQDSYLFLKNCHAIKEDAGFAQTGQNHGIPMSQTWLLADWLGRDCPFFVGDESTVYNNLRTSKLAVARGKQLAALPGVDRVMSNAPESKMTARTLQNTQQDDGSLF